MRVSEGSRMNWLASKVVLLLASVGKSFKEWMAISLSNFISFF